MEWTTLQNSDIKARGQAVHLSRPIQNEDLALQIQSASDMEQLCKIAVEVRWKKTLGSWIMA